MQAVTVIGIDPGSQRTGWGVVREVSGVLQLVDCGVVRTASAGKEFSDRLARIYHELSGVLARLKPEEAAIEQVFTAKNAASALKLGQARGAAISAVVLRDLPVHEYAAKEVKLAVVGRGSAEKTQIQHMVGIMLNLHGKLQADAADALAVAITHAHVRASANRLGVAAREAWGRKGRGRR